ncbi:MAG: S66 peptidase family protein [Myxococcota bacterium]
MAVAAPAGPVDPEVFHAGCALWREAGFRVRTRDDVLCRRGYLAGDDARRAAELMDFVADPEVAAIVCARGGYGVPRILDRLDPAAFRAARKPLVGFSDVTALLLWQRRRAGLMGLHGPMLERGADADQQAFAELLDWLGGGTPPPLRGRGIRPGVASGRLVGGNLVLVAASLGSAWEVDTRGAILLVEEVGEAPYRVDRLLQQLRHAGKLDALAGLGVGDVSTCHDDRYREPDVATVVAEVAAGLGVPVVTELPFGHGARNRPWPVGARATIDGDAGEIRVLEAGVVRTSW